MQIFQCTHIHMLYSDDARLELGNKGRVAGGDTELADLSGQHDLLHLLVLENGRVRGAEVEHQRGVRGGLGRLREGAAGQGEHRANRYLTEHSLLIDSFTY